MNTETPLEEQAHDHPTEFQYIKVAIFLAIATAIEVGVIYVTALEALLVPILGFLMVVKFVAVAAYFMHLKQDSKIFRRLFVLGIVLAIVIFGIVLWTFTVAERLPGAAS